MEKEPSQIKVLITQNPFLAATLIFSIALIIITFIFVGKIYQFRGEPNTISVTGSTQQVIASDVVVWQASFSRTVGVGSDEIKKGTAAIKADASAITTYLHTSNIADSDITFDPLNISPNYTYTTDKDGNNTQVFTGYTISEGFTIQSSDIVNVGNAAKNSGSLIADGILFQSNAPQYFYSKLASLRISMLGAATQDALGRAQKIADSSHASLGKLRSASMGVVQITPEYSSDVSEDGEYDTSSIKKQVTIIVHEVFFVK